ncbi:MAG: MauE/DoxX family redox-associated membrane protein [Bacteroidota bacterium]
MALQKSSSTTIQTSLKVLLALLFLVSALAKLYPKPYFALTTFEIKQLVPIGFSENMAAYFSRVLIGCEFALGFLLLQKNFFKKLVLPTSFLILLIFSLHLTYEIFTKGNAGNCGCFGALLPMTPLQAVIKNIIAMGLIVWLYRLTTAKDAKNFYLLTTVTFASVLAVFMVGMKTSSSSKNNAPVKFEEKIIEIDSIVKIDGDTAKSVNTVVIKKDTLTVKVENKGPKAKKSGYANYFGDIDQGKKVLCFFAPGCDHCKDAAKDLTQLKKELKSFDIRIVFMDEEAELIPDFFSFAGAKYPHQVLDIASFWNVLGTSKDTPGVFYLWNGNLVKEYNGINDKKFVKSDFKKIVTKE